MTEFKDFDEKRIVEYTDDELRAFLNEVEMRRSILNTNCADEMAVYLNQKDFDVYSFWGGRKIKKVSKKYAGLLDAADYFEELLKKELEKRDKYNEEQRYSGKSLVERQKLSTEEFLKKEEDKTWAIRSKIE